MPAGAGSATVAWTPETSYLGGVSDTPTYRLPGTNVQAQRVELTRNLLEILAPGDVETQTFLAQQLEGQLNLSWILKNDEYHRLAFNDGFTGLTSGLVNSAEFYLGVDTISGTTERQIKGWAPGVLTVEYTGSDSPVRVTMQGAYGDEVKNTTLTPGTIEDPGDEVPGHGASLSIGGTSFGDYLQSATISIENISRLIRGANQKPIEAVAGNVSESVDIEHIYAGPELYERALGAVGSSTVQEDVSETTASISFAANGTTHASYDFARVAPDTYDWQDLVNNDAELSESITLNAAGITASDPTV